MLLRIAEKGQHIVAGTPQLYSCINITPECSRKQMEMQEENRAKAKQQSPSETPKPVFL